MPPVPDNQRQAAPKAILLSNGVSQQPPQVRLPNQVAGAINVTFSVVNGASRRPGSWVQQHLAAGLLPAANNRMHGIVRDQNEQYLIIHNRTGAGAVLRILELATNRWATIDISAAAQAYLNAASPDEFRFRTLVDYTLVLNTDKALAGTERTGAIAGKSGVITANTAALPTHVTSAAHGLVTGDVIRVEGSDSSVTIDGIHTVTVLDANTFTVAVNVGFPGSHGSWVQQAISEASPAALTSVAHGLTSGQTVTIEDSDCTPTVDGTRVVTVVDADHFTVPVSVTTKGFTGNWHYAALDAGTMPMQLVRQNTGASGSITAASIASPTAVTSADHGLVTGQTVVIAGSDSTPTIDGTRVVTVVDDDHFTVPVNVTVAGTTGSWTAAAYFTLGVVAWSDRQSGGPDTNPLLDIWADGQKVSDLRYWRGRLCFFSGNRVTTSQAGDLFNFWIEDVNAVGDSDPIDVPLSSEQATDLDYAVPIRQSLLAFARAGRQFAIGAGEVLTPISITAKPITAHLTLPVEPAVMDPSVYYATDNGGFLQLWEYIFDEVDLPSEAEDVSKHAPQFCPFKVNIPVEIAAVDSAAYSGIRTMLASPEQGMVIMLRRDQVEDGEVFSRNLFIYRIHHLERQKVQSAWTNWLVAGVRGVHDIVVIGHYLYLLVHCGTNSPPDFYVARMNLTDETASDAVPVPTT